MELHRILWLIIGGLLGWLASILMPTTAQQGIVRNIKTRRPNGSGRRDAANAGADGLGQYATRRSYRHDCRNCNECAGICTCPRNLTTNVKGALRGASLRPCLVMMIAALYWPNAVVIPVALALLMTFLLTPIVKVGQRLATFAPHAASRLASRRA